MFYPEKCNECGICLSSCRYSGLSIDEAREQIRDLKADKPARILTDCITCMACNEFCPEGANPYDLILSQQEKQAIRMVPPEAVAGIEKTLGGQPSQVVKGDSGKPVLCLCTMEQAFPAGILDSSLFEGMTIARGGDFFSRIVYLHTGMESVVKHHARDFINSLSAIGCSEVVFVHADCYVLAAHKAKEYGVDVPFKPVHIVEYLLSQLKQRKADIIPLNCRAAWHRPCISRYTPEIEPLVDQLFALIGVTRVERVYDRKEALCCGLGLQGTDVERKEELARLNFEDAVSHQAGAMVFCARAVIRLWAVHVRTMD